MKFLIDTNIVIPLEPQAPPELGSAPPMAMDLLALLNETQSQLYVHPEIKTDVARDSNELRRRWTLLVLNKYRQLPDPPQPDARHIQVLGEPSVGSNHWVDHQLLVAVERDAVDYLVTEDGGIHSKAKRLRISERVLRVVDAITVLRGLFPKFAPAPPSVTQVSAHRLDERDPIFDSFRPDYADFDGWLSKAKRENRPTWIIEEPDGKLAGVCIMKHEDTGEYGLSRRSAKICTFKIGEDAHGRRYGELLLKPALRYAFDNNLDHIYLTAYAKQEHLLAMFQELGFQVREATNASGELVVWRRVRPQPGDEEVMTPAVFNHRNVPLSASWNGQIWLVPIKPAFHSLLFPDYTRQEFLPNMSPSHPFGNGIRKAYLCRSGATTVAEGDVLAFYRSDDVKAVVGLGAVDDSMRSASPATVARYVARRTVYGEDAIREMCGKGEILAIRFKQVLRGFREISLEELKEQGISHPQTLVRLRGEVKLWLRNRCGM